jgi:hypothetical protein
VTRERETAGIARESERMRKEKREWKEISLRKKWR